jgi:hypothetical protein
VTHTVQRIGWDDPLVPRLLAMIPGPVHHGPDRTWWRLDRDGTPIGVASGGPIRGEFYLEHVAIDAAARSFAGIRTLLGAIRADLASRWARVCLAIPTGSPYGLGLAYLGWRCYAVTDALEWWTAPTEATA